MGWRWRSDRLLPEPMTTHLTDAYIGHEPQYVNNCAAKLPLNSNHRVKGKQYTFPRDNLMK